MNKYEEHKKVTEALDAALIDDRGESPGGSKHYSQGGPEPKVLFIENNLPAYKALAIKYIFRAGLKGDEKDPVLDELRDLRKALFWINERYKFLVSKLGATREEIGPHLSPDFISPDGKKHAILCASNSTVGSPCNCSLSRKLYDLDASKYSEAPVKSMCNYHGGLEPGEKCKDCDYFGLGSVHDPYKELRIEYSPTGSTKWTCPKCDEPLPVHLSSKDSHKCVSYACAKCYKPVKGPRGTCTSCYPFLRSPWAEANTDDRTA